MSMIKQNHSNVTAVTTLFVVLLGVGLSKSVSADNSHNRVHTVIQHAPEQRNIRVKDKHSRLSKNTKIPKKHVKYKAVGTASWYGFESGNRTASGEIFNPYGNTAAHRTLPLHTKVRVTNMKNKKSIIVRINDRGPFHGNRIIDLSMGSAKRIGIGGIGKVKIETL